MSYVYLSFILRCLVFIETDILILNDHTAYTAGTAGRAIGNARAWGPAHVQQCGVWRPKHRPCGFICGQRTSGVDALCAMHSCSVRWSMMISIARSRQRRAASASSSAILACFAPDTVGAAAERERVLFIGTEFSILYTSMHSPA